MERKEKWLAQIFRKDLTERKLERTRMTVLHLKNKYVFYPN